MRKIATVFVIFLVGLGGALAQIPSLIEVSAEDMSNYFGNNFSSVLLYTAQGADTIVLTTCADYQRTCVHDN